MKRTDPVAKRAVSRAIHQPAVMPSRRLVLQSGGLALFGMGTGAGFLERMVHAGAQVASGSDQVLVVVFLRGAMDGLMAVQPVDDPHLASLRPALALRTSGENDLLHDLGNGYGMHPALAPISPLWDAGALAVVHGCGSPHPTRSHFDAQDYMETAVLDKKSGDGWLARLARRNAADDSLFGSVAIGGRSPRSFQGATQSLVIDDLERFALFLGGKPRSRALEALYRESEDGLLRSRGRDLFDALRLLNRQELRAYKAARGVRYPNSALGRSLLQLAFLIRQGVGLRIGFAESTGWDTHVRQGRGSGSFAMLASDLASSLAAFWSDLGDFADNVTVITMTEFGRTVAQNGSGGTDHGHGSCMFLLGPRVYGGKVHGVLPELQPDALYEGRDLPATTDFRAVLADVADKVFNVRDDPFLFPGWEGQGVPVLWG